VAVYAGASDGQLTLATEAGRRGGRRRALPTQHRLDFGIQVKKGKLDASDVTKADSATIAEIHNQALMMQAHEIVDPEHNKRSWSITPSSWLAVRSRRQHVTGWATP
jgi:hypothetical protein